MTIAIISESRDDNVKSLIKDTSVHIDFTEIKNLLLYNLSNQYGSINF